MILAFDSNGNLPPGIHQASWKEFVDRFGYNERRQWLLTGLRNALSNLKEAGCTIVYVNGSFITQKAEPRDFDGCWDWSGVDEDKVDPVLLTFSEERAAQKSKYGGELFPNCLEGVSELSFLAYFQRDKYTGEPKGIVQLEIGEIDD